MEHPKLLSIVKTVSSHLTAEAIPFAAIGAIALGIYGLPRYTADIDLLSESRFADKIRKIMKRLEYTCYQKTEMFVQFDSENGELGRVDFLLVETHDGKELLNRRNEVQDKIWGQVPVIQPSDYIILKLMAIANNPDRAGSDEADIVRLLQCFREDIISENFEQLDRERIIRFADRFNQKKRMLTLFGKMENVSPETNRFSI